MSKFRVAIDGPSGAGKSTIAKEVARELNIDYIDTGAMYRAIAYKILAENIDVEDSIQLEGMLENTAVDFEGGRILLDGVDISDKIRSPQISKMASDCSALRSVREKLVDLQRQMASKKSVIMDGRDIGTNVLPDAEYKFFITASPEERGRRRFLELLEKGEEISYSEVLEDMKRRDYNDSNRKLNPLIMAEDAILLDTTEMTITEVKESLLKEIESGTCKTL